MYTHTHTHTHTPQLYKTALEKKKRDFEQYFIRDGPRREKDLTSWTESIINLGCLSNLLTKYPLKSLCSDQRMLFEDISVNKLLRNLIFSKPFPLEI